MLNHLTKSPTSKKGNTSESSAKNGHLPTEHEEQVKLVSEFRKRFPGVRIFAIPNGGSRSITTAARLKAEGVVRGVPDLFIPEWFFWIELKRLKKGVLSPQQKDWRDYLNQHGYKSVVCNGWEEAISECERRCKEFEATPKLEQHNT